MFRSSQIITLAGAGTLSAAGAVLAADGSGDMSAQIAELRAANEALAAKVAKLEASADGEQWLTEARADEIRAIVTDVLADADSRTSLQSSGATAGWNKDQGGFFIASPSGDFKLNIKGQVQFRWAFNDRDTDTAGADPKPDTWGFENRRTKLAFTGFVVDPSWTYEVQPVFNRAPGSVSSGAQTFSSGNIVGSVENIWIQKDFGQGTTLRVGQFKAPFLREELVSSSAQLAVERTLVNDVYSTKFSQGIQLEHTVGSLRAQLFYGDGLRANATSITSSASTNAGGFAGAYTTPFNTNPTNWAFAGRVEWLGQGQWKQFRDLTSMRGEEKGWMLGFGAMGQSLRPGSEGPVTASTTDWMWGATADFTYDFGGANLFMYGVYRFVGLEGEVATRGGGSSDSMDQFGAVVQGGVFVSDEVELYARYEWGNTDTDKFRTGSGGLATRELDSIATVGMNWYIGGNKDLKWSSDFGYAFDPVGDFNSSGADWLSDVNSTANTTNEGQWVVRSQIQLLF
ncbi:MAG: porin [Planctomycetota bacterium]